MIEKSDSKWGSLATVSIPGQTPRRRTAVRVISFKILQQRSSRKDAR
ncbi:MAG: hypothetical protein V3V31_06485 [Methylococcales bacterium]